LDILCEAFRILARRRAERIALAVAGQAAGRGNRFWKRLLKDLEGDGLADRVEYAGEVDLEGKAAFLRGCSVFSVPSRYSERRAVAVLEALACGVPVVVPERPGYDEVVSLTGGGVLVAPDDPDALAEGLARLLDHPDDALRMSRSAVEGVRKHFSANLMVDRTLQVYDDLVGREVGSAAAQGLEGESDAEAVDRTGDDRGVVCRGRSNGGSLRHRSLLDL